MNHITKFLAKVETFNNQEDIKTYLQTKYNDIKQLENIADNLDPYVKIQILLMRNNIIKQFRIINQEPENVVISQNDDLVRLMQELEISFNNLKKLIKNTIEDSKTYDDIVNFFKTKTEEYEKIYNENLLTGEEIMLSLMLNYIKELSDEVNGILLKMKQE